MIKLKMWEYHAVSVVLELVRGLVTSLALYGERQGNSVQHNCSNAQQVRGGTKNVIVWKPRGDIYYTKISVALCIICLRCTKHLLYANMRVSPKTKPRNSRYRNANLASRVVITRFSRCYNNNILLSLSYQ